MPDYFEQGFFVRKPAWHGMGTVLDDYPGREQGMVLAGHAFEVIERPIYDAFGAPIKGWKSLVKDITDEQLRAEDDTQGDTMNVVKQSYGVIQNSVGWDIVDAIIGEGAKYETGITLKGGAVCSVLAYLDEPMQVPGDDAFVLPWLNVSWAHDGSASLTARPTNIRTVCWNTQSAAEALGKRMGVEFTFRHTSKVMDRIADAKMALKGVRDQRDEYMELAKELANTPVTTKQRELFVTEFIPMPPEALVSKRVMNNVEKARGDLRGLFGGPTIPESHELTAYGLHLAGVEFLDHLRGYRNTDTLYGRQLLRQEPAKAKLTGLIRDVVAA